MRFRHEVKIERQHIGTHKRRWHGTVRADHAFLDGLLHLIRDHRVFRSIRGIKRLRRIFFREDTADMRESTDRVPTEDRRRIAGALCHDFFEILGIQPVFALTWHQPLAVVISGIPQVLLDLIGAFAILRLLGFCLTDDIITPAAHAIILPLQHLCVSGHLVHGIRNDHGSVAPAGGGGLSLCASHQVHQLARHGIRSIFGNDHRNDPVAILLLRHIFKPTAEKNCAVLVEHSRPGVDQHVARPARLLALWAVCRDGEHVGCLRIPDIAV